MGDDEELTQTIEEQLAEDVGEEPQGRPRSEKELQEENAETSLDQPSDGTS